MGGVIDERFTRGDVNVVGRYPHRAFPLQLPGGYGKAARAVRVGADVEPRRARIHGGIIAHAARGIGIGGGQQVRPDFLEFLELRLGPLWNFEGELDAVDIAAAGPAAGGAFTGFELIAGDRTDRYSRAGIHLDVVNGRGGPGVSPRDAHRKFLRPGALRE